MDLLIPAAFGIEAVVRRQMEKLGYAGAKATDGRLLLENADARAVARLNLFLRSGERVLVRLAQFPAPDFDALYDNLRTLRWQDYIAPDARILVDAKSTGSKLHAVKSVSSVTKKAVVDKLKSTYRCELSESGGRVRIDLALRGDVATVSLDTSGEGLFKRGYRTLSVDAPLKETTAAALLDLSVYRREKQLADLFCGSGTIAIEAAMRELFIAPGLKRSFDCEAWRGAGAEGFSAAFAAAREEARDAHKICPLNITACDIDKNNIAIAKHHARQAGVEQYIHFQVADFSAFSSRQRYGVLISNPPYGERLESGGAEEAERIYSGLGTLYKTLPDWSFYILTGYENAQRRFGRRADKNRKLYNANILCYYYSFLGKKPK